MKRNNRETGSRYEKRAGEYLKERGIVLLEFNYRTQSGEIDLIGKEDGYLVFIEVKYRSSDRAGSGLDAITEKKAARIRRAAGQYLLEHGFPEDTPCRFDAVSVDGENITYLKDAF